MGHDAGIALADSRGLDDDHVEGGEAHRLQQLLQPLRDLGVGASRGEGTHVDAGMVYRVHADAIAEQRPAGTAAARVDGEDADPEPVVEVQPEAAHDLVRERRLAGPASAGDADDDGAPADSHAARQLLATGAVELVALHLGKQATERRPMPGRESVEGNGRRFQASAAGDHVVDDPLEPELLSVRGRVDAFDPVAVQLLDFRGHDDAPAPAEHANAARPLLLQLVDEVLEVLEVPALVGAHRDRIGVFLHRRAHHFAHRAVVTEMDHLRARPLQNPAHDVDRGIVPVEEARRGHEAKGRHAQRILIRSLGIGKKRSVHFSSAGRRREAIGF